MGRPLLAGAAKHPTWVIRWQGAFGICYIGRDPATMRAAEWRGVTVYSVELAFPYPTREAAEGAALVWAAKYPRFLGELSAREWDGKRKRP